MPISRIFQATSLAVETHLVLDGPASHHLARVLRAKIQDEVIVFNGEGGEYHGKISHIDKKNVTVLLTLFVSREAESTLHLTLAQGISRGEKMDYTIQKAVELGVSRIVPLLTERCNVKLDDERREKRFQHWQSIVVSACEQSGRNRIPELLAPQSLSNWLPIVQADQCFVLAPGAEKSLQQFSLLKSAQVVLLIGPEGGLSQIEISQSLQKGFAPLALGPRILRTETAAVAALTALQCCFGDMSG
jgi:16S rRNA (uracil1498-N3)-methyltransferase